MGMLECIFFCLFIRHKHAHNIHIRRALFKKADMKMLE